MAIIDTKLELSDNQSMAAAKDAFKVSDNVVDLGSNASARRIFEGQPLYLNIVIGATATSGSAYKFIVRVADAANLTSNPIDLVTLPTLDVSSLTKGKKYSIPLPAGLEVKRYIGMRSQAVTKTQASLKISAWISGEPITHEHVLSATSGG